MKKAILFLTITINFLSLNAQNDNSYAEKNNLFPKHEIGFSIGRPSAILHDKINFDDHISMANMKIGESRLETTEYLVVPRINYNYHFNLQHSIGASLSWTGKNEKIDWIHCIKENEHDIYDHSYSEFHGRGWKHYFTLQGNYRHTYYRKDNTSLYCGINLGTTLCVFDKSLEPNIDYVFRNKKNVRHYFRPAIHLDALGIETGKKYLFNMGLGIGNIDYLRLDLGVKFKSKVLQDVKDKNDVATKHFEKPTQAPYKFSIGGMFPIPNATGLSFKFFLDKDIALQTDILYSVTATWYANEGDVYPCIYIALGPNINMMYQKKLKDKKSSESFGFIGGGLTAGYELIHKNNKFGANIIMGLEWVSKKTPISSVQIDIRPGYGMLFNSGENLNRETIFFSLPEKNPWSHFDFLMGFTIRRSFVKK